MLYFVTYDGGTGLESAVVDANDFNEAEEWASIEAEELFYQSGIAEYDMPDMPDYYDEDWEEEFNNEMASNIFYSVVDFDENNPDHVECLECQGGEAIEL